MRIKKLIYGLLIGFILVVLGATLFSWHVLTNFEVKSSYPDFVELERLEINAPDLEYLRIDANGVNVEVVESQRYKNKTVIVLEGVNLDDGIRIKTRDANQRITIDRENEEIFFLVKQTYQDFIKSVQDEVLYNYEYLYRVDVTIYTDDFDEIASNVIRR